MKNVEHEETEEGENVFLLRNLVRIKFLESFGKNSGTSNAMNS